MDTETTGLDPHTGRIRLIQIAAEGLPVLVIDCFSLLPKGLAAIRDALEGSSVKRFTYAHRRSDVRRTD